MTKDELIEFMKGNTWEEVCKCEKCLKSDNPLMVIKTKKRDVKNSNKKEK